MSPQAVARIVFDPDGRSERLPLYADGTIDLIGRGGCRVRSGTTVSFSTYFNAFPAWHWHEFTTVAEVALAVDLAGSGALVVYRSDGAGRASEIGRHAIAGSLVATMRFDLRANADGGWLWFDLEAASDGIELRSAEWQVDEAPRETRLATLSMTTMDKPDFALGVLRRLADEPSALAALDEVVVVDQGTRKVADDAAFAGTRERLGGRLRIIDQANLGGSGGFARGMLEVLDADRSGSVILLDDDVEIEPESIARAVAFASYTSAPTIVGGHFFDLVRPLRLHAFSERVTVDDFDWGPIGPREGHDFGVASLRGTPWLHAPTRPDYNGWWFCLIPVDVLRAIGLSLPAFLKWDDAEFGLRAGAAGIPTVSLPGMAIWHVSWLDKNDSLGWQSFYHARNRLVAALVDDRGPGRRLPSVNLALDIRYLITMDYHVAELRHLAYESVLAGPSGLHAELGTRLPQMIEVMSRYRSGVPVPLDDEVGGVEQPDPPFGGVRLVVETLRAVVVQWCTPLSAIPQEPEARLPYARSRWWRLARYRHVLAVSSDATSYRRHVLEPKIFRRMLVRTLIDSLRMHRAWVRLGERYRASRQDLVAIDVWRTTLGR